MEKRNGILPTPYPDLNSVLRDVVESIQSVLDTNFVGAYLQGSFAVGDFDLHSDVDFIVVTEEELSHEQVHGLLQRCWSIPSLSKHCARTFGPPYIIGARRL